MKGGIEVRNIFVTFLVPCFINFLPLPKTIITLHEYIVTSGIVLNVHSIKEWLTPRSQSSYLNRKYDTALFKSQYAK